MEATQNQILECVVPCIPDRHVLEQTTICAHDLVGTGAHLTAPADHVPCTPSPQPRLALWEEMRTHVLQACCGKGRRNHLVTCVSLWNCQSGIEVASNQWLQLRPLWSRRPLVPDITPLHTTAVLLMTAES